MTPSCRQKVLLPIEFQMLMTIPSAAELLPSNMLIDIALCEELFHTATGTATTACEAALWPAGTFARAYAANRRAAIESIMEADPIATCLRTIMADRSMWMGSASDLMRLYAQSARDDVSAGGAGIKNPRALAGRLRRAQTFLRSLGIEITFSREGRTGTRMIKVSTNSENCVSTVSIVGACRSNGAHGDPHGLSRVLE